jgi:4-hydroxy-3-polyprenylbenzoate decarboxylase
LAIVSVREGGNEIGQKEGNAIGRRRAWSSKIIVVDDDVDVFDMRQVVHALSVKCHSTRGIFLKDTPPGTGNPFSPADNAREKKESVGAVAVFDCTWPPDWPRDQIPVKASFDRIYPPEIRDRVLANWSEYGLKPNY